MSQSRGCMWPWTWQNAGQLFRICRRGRATQMKVYFFFFFFYGIDHLNASLFKSKLLKNTSVYLRNSNVDSMKVLPCSEFRAKSICAWLALWAISSLQVSCCMKWSCVLQKCRDNDIWTTWCDLSMINNNSSGSGLFIDLKMKQTAPPLPQPLTSHMKTNFCVYVHVSVL